MKYQFSESMGRVTQELSRIIGKLLEKKFNIKGYNVTRDEWVVIVYLAHYKKLNQQNLAEKSGRDKVAVKRILDKLQHEGYVKREVYEKDKRNNIIALTAEGKKLYKILEPIAGETLEIAYQNISTKKIEECILIMKLVMANVQKSIDEKTIVKPLEGF